MDVVAPFGFVTACHAGDKFMVKATLASMRHYCPNIPICLLADGEVEVGDLKQEYDLIVLRPRQLPNEEMRNLVAGNYRIKLAAMWEGPFEHYVWVDSDAIVWGDFTDQVRRDVDFQIFWSEISIDREAYEVPSWLPHFYFDLDRLLKRDNQFEWRGWPYFSAGAYACRRNCISFEEWQHVGRWNESNEDPVFKFGDQGQLNYMVHKAAQTGALRVIWSDLQYGPRHHGREEIDRDTAKCGWRWPERIARPRIAHFAGQKPHVMNPRAYSRAFTIARLEHHRRHLSEFRAWAAILSEEWPIYRGKLQRRLLHFAGVQ